MCYDFDTCLLLPSLTLTPLDVANLEHVATAALAAISNSPAPTIASPSSTAKRKARVRRLPESKAPHIMTSFDKDLNLAAITEVGMES